MISCRESVRHLYGSEMTASKELEHLCQTFIAPVHCERMLEFFRLDQLSERMGTQGSVEAGMNAHLSKTIDMKRVLKTLAEWVR